MLLLEKYKACPYGHRCQYNRMHECWGARPDRDSEFKCSYVDNTGHITEGGFRNPRDKTGNMTILSE